MASRIAPFIPVRQKAKPVKDKSYLEFLHELPCVITGQTEVQAAHLSTEAREWGHTGRGKGQKASDRWCLPLSATAHHEQHHGKGGEMAFWDRHGINPHALACALYSKWCELDGDAVSECTEIIDNARSLSRRQLYGAG